jgi:hypothetical protein
MEPLNEENSQATAKKPAFSLKPTKQTCMMLGGAIALILLGGGSLYAWQSGEIDAATRQTQEKRKELEDSRKIARRREEVQGEYEALQKKLKYLESSVAPGAEFEAGFIEQMTQWAKKEKVQVVDITPTWEHTAKPAPPPKKKSEEGGEASKTDDSAKKDEKKPKENPYDLYHLDITARGQYSNVVHFFASLNQFPKIIAVEKCDVQPDDQTKSENAGVVVAKIKLTGFAFKESEYAVKAMEKAGNLSGNASSSGIRNPLLPGDGASSKMRSAQNDVTNSAAGAPGSPSPAGAASSTVAPSNAGTPNNSGAPGIPRPKQIP